MSDARRGVNRFGLRNTIATALLVVGLLPVPVGLVLVLVMTRRWAAGAPPSVQDLALYGILAVLALAVFVLVAVAVVSRRLVRPMQALQEGVRRIGEGDLDHRLDISTPRELAQVAGAFNAMAQRLAESYRTLEQTVADRTMALTALHSLSITANRSLDPEEILSSVLERVPVVLNLEGGFIRLADDKGLTLRAHRGVSDRFVEASPTCAIGEGLSGRVAQSGAPMVSEGLAETSEALLFREGFRVAACVPITAKGHVLGTLAVASRYHRAFTTQDVQLLTAIGSQLGTALENAGLYERACAIADEFQKLDRLKTEFLSNVSHELRIPLTSIIGFAELLLERISGELNPEQEKHLRTMLESGRHLLDMINNLLDLSKIKAGMIAWHATAFDVRPLIALAERTIRPLVVKKHLHLAIEVDDRPTIALADEGRVRQVLLNLLSNAVKFTPSGGTVRLSARRIVDDRGAAVELRVDDTGIGIAAEDLDRIFNEFQQVDGSPTRDYPGTGLGLSITKRLVELQGGTILVESRLGEGSRFVVRLPQGTMPEAAESAARPAGIMQSVMESLVAAAAARAHDARRSPKVVVVTPDPSVRLTARAALEPEGYEVHVVESGEPVLARVRALRPFLVILDVVAPDLPAWSILRDLRSLPDVQTVLLALADDRRHACSLAPVGYVPTPISPDGLRSALRQYGLLRAVRRRPSTVLVVAPPDTVEAVRSVLRHDGVGVVGADTPDPVALAGELQPDLVLCDLLAATPNPFDLVQRFAQHPAARAIPLMVVMPDAVSDIDRSRLTERARAAAASGETLQEDVVSACRKLERWLPERAGLVDPVTRLYTERYFRHCLADEVDRAWRLHRPFSLLVFEADGLTRYGESAGAPRGERLLREVADLLRRHTRMVNPMCRYGPAAFALLLTETSKEGARFIGEKLRALAADAPFAGRDSERRAAGLDPGGTRLTVSGGVAAFFSDAETAEGLVEAAFRALQRAQREGGNRVDGADGGDRDTHREPDALAANDPA
ncbi:MAG: diguanylate cyclase [Nitrospirae bacterium]|nr:diguanylate cyclase [Nitrospirota bacterium]